MHSFVSSTEYEVRWQGQQSKTQSSFSPTVTQEAERYSAAYIINWETRDHSPEIMEYDSASMERKHCVYQTDRSGLEVDYIHNYGEQNYKY